MNAALINQETERWRRYARQDLIEAEAMLTRPDYVPRHACLLAQQASEKALKCALVFLQIRFPKSHDLDALRDLLPAVWRVVAECPNLSKLSQWAVEARYPGFWPEATIADAQQSVAQARLVFEAVHFDLAKRGLA
ncbi:MAG: HEPN domain-containing protein [Candidatus Sumerlaeota bacterium]|nr:HEPN domain-containing protein [Candidatus Sumerlaeota bacterium]